MPKNIHIIAALRWHAGRSYGTAANQRCIKGEEQRWNPNNVGAILRDRQKKNAEEGYKHANTYTRAQQDATTTLC